MNVVLKRHKKQKPKAQSQKGAQLHILHLARKHMLKI
jgi:hypothetical protein